MIPKPFAANMRSSRASTLVPLVPAKSKTVSNRIFLPPSVTHPSRGSGGLLALAIFTMDSSCKKPSSTVDVSVSRWLALLLLLASLACSGPQPTFHAERTPKVLSEWGMFTRTAETLRPAAGVTPYDLNTTLFTDYAHKLRTVWLPEGTTAHYSDSRAMDFPVGTVITKTFFYPIDANRADANQVLRTTVAAEGVSSISLANHRLIETRVLAHRASGWVALPYVWNQEQTEATLEIIGAMVDLELMDPDDPAEGTAFHYVVPDANQCSGCHRDNLTTKEILPIGPKARHLNRDFAYSTDGQRTAITNQLTHWQASGLLDQLPDDSASIPANAQWTGDVRTLNAAMHDPAMLEKMARSYLDINCSHCHNPSGPADTSGLILEPQIENKFQLGICKPPVAAGRGTGDRLYAIHPGNAEGSILHHRMNSVKPDVAMPELGRSTIHTEGVLLVDSWINSLSGDC